MDSISLKEASQKQRDVLLWHPQVGFARVARVHVVKRIGQVSSDLQAWSVTPGEI